MTQQCPNKLNLFRSYYISDVILYSCITSPNSAYHTQVSDKETAAYATLAFGCSQYIMTVWLPLNSPYPWHIWDGIWFVSHLPKDRGFYSGSMRRRNRSFLVFMRYSSALWTLTLIMFEYLTLSQLTEKVPSQFLYYIGFKSAIYALYIAPATQ